MLFQLLKLVVVVVLMLADSSFLFLSSPGGPQLQELGDGERNPDVSYEINSWVPSPLPAGAKVKQGPRAFWKKLGKFLVCWCSLLKGNQQGGSTLKWDVIPVPPPSEVELEQVPGTPNPPNSPTLLLKTLH